MTKLFKFKKNKKGSSLDSFFVAISFFGVAIFLLIANIVWSSLTTDDLNTEFWGKTDVGNSSKANAQSAYDNLDNLGMIVYFALHLGILVTAFLLRTHPIVFVAAILLTAILAIVSAPLSNAYETTINSNTDFTAAHADLPMVGFIMFNLPKFEIIWAFITAIVMFGIAKGESYI